MSIRSALLLTCLLLAAIPVGRIIFMLARRQPRLARTISHHYPDSERMAEGDYHRAALFDRRISRHDFHYRDIDARIAYEVNGREIRSDVQITTHKGDVPDSLPIVWVDPDRPERATTRGLSFWLSWLLLIPPIAYAAWQLPE
jgi:hypothetical protein